MGQAVTVANASGDRLYVKVQSSVEFSEKTDFTVSGSTPSTAAEATGKVDVEVSVFLIIKPPDSSVSCCFPSADGLVDSMYKDRDSGIRGQAKVKASDHKIQRQRIRNKSNEDVLTVLFTHLSSKQ